MQSRLSGKEHASQGHLGGIWWKHCEYCMSYEVIRTQNHRRLYTFNSHPHSRRFKPGLVDNVFARYRGSTSVERHHLKSLEMLQREFDLEKGDLIGNLQLRHFYKTEVKKSNYNRG